MNDLIVTWIANLSQLFGGSPGCAIIALSLVVRVALLPLTIKLARRAQRNQEIIRKLQPEIDELKKRFEKKPERLFEEMRLLYQKHDCTFFDLPVVLGTFVQFPIFAMLYSAIRTSLGTGVPFGWIKNLAAPDFILTLIITSLAGVSAYLMPSASEQLRNGLIAFQIIVTFLLVWKLAAGLGLYWASSNLVGLSQTLWLRYRPVTTSRSTA
jgi:YidC/Oxa1 family membrane protein insertase